MKSLKISPQFLVASISLVCLAIIAFLGKSYETSIQGINSAFYAKLSMNVTRGDGWWPTLPMIQPNSVPAHSNKKNKNQEISSSHKNDWSSTSLYFNTEPFFFFWLNGKIMRALGPSAWSARVLTAVFSTSCVVLILILGTTLESPLYGFVASLFYLLTKEVILTGASVGLDSSITFFILLSLFFWLKETWLATGIAAGIGLWFQIPLGLLVYPTLGLVACARGRIKFELKKLFYSLAVCLATGSLVWFTLGFLGGWEHVGDYWIQQLLGAPLKIKESTQKTDGLIFFQWISIHFLPGMPFLILAIFPILKQRLWKNLTVQISLAALSIILVLSLIPKQGNLESYFMCGLPFLSLLAAFSTIDVLRSVEDNFYSIITVSSVIEMAFLLSTPTPLGSESSVHIKKFAPFIQNYGDCNDSVLIVRGKEELPSLMSERQYVLNFYTDRIIYIGECEAVSFLLRKPNHQWMILAEEDFNRCLTAMDKKKFPYKIKMGKQLLLGKRVQTESHLTGLTVDISPLERELLPFLGCL